MGFGAIHGWMCRCQLCRYMGVCICLRAHAYPFATSVPAAPACAGHRRHASDRIPACQGDGCTPQRDSPLTVTVGPGPLPPYRPYKGHTHVAWQRSPRERRRTDLKDGLLKMRGARTSRRPVGIIPAGRSDKGTMTRRAAVRRRIEIGGGAPKPREAIGCGRRSAWRNRGGSKEAWTGFSLAQVLLPCSGRDRGASGDSQGC